MIQKAINNLDDNFLYYSMQSYKKKSDVNFLTTFDFKFITRAIKFDSQIIELSSSLLKMKL